MMKFRFSSLRFQLILIVLLAFLPIVALTIFQAHEERMRAAEEVKRDASKISLFIAEHQRRAIESAQQFLTFLVDHPGIFVSDPSRLEKQLAAFVTQETAYENLGVIRANGEVFTAAVPLKENVNLSQNPCFRKVLETRTFAIGDCGIGKTGDREIINVCYPSITGTGKIQAVVFAAISMDFFFREAARLQLPQKAVLSIINRDGQVLAQFPEPQKEAGKPALGKSLIETILTRKEGVTEITEKNGVRYLYAFRPVEEATELALFVNVGIPTKVAFREADRLMKRHLAFLALIAIFALALTGWVGESFILRQMKNLTREAKQIESGNLKARSGVSYKAGELGELAHAFDEMAQALEARQTEAEKARSSLEENAALLNKAQEAISVLGLEGNILYWNKGSERVYGWLKEEALGANINELLFKKISPAVIEARKAVTSRGEWSGELAQVTREGKNIIVENRWTLVRDDEGHPKSILMVNADVTEKKKLEARFLRADRLENIGMLAGGIAHDLNNVLTPMMMSLDLLKKKLTDPESRLLLESLGVVVQRGADLVKQVLTFAKGAGEERVLVKPVALIREIERIASETFPKSIKILTSVSENVCDLYGDPTQLIQVLLNLCVNARDAMPEGGVLSVSVEAVTQAPAGFYDVFTVSDTGSGMPKEILDKIFDPFFTTKEPGKGTGLGLTTVAAIVKGHKGFIDVYSELGKGSQFKVYLPATRVALPEKVREEKEEMPLGHGEKVLVVDDEASIREVMRTMLQTYGYEVVTAANGAEAVQLYEVMKDEINVVLTDLYMPVMDGAALIQAIREMDPKAKVILTTGMGAGPDVTQVENLGVHDFLPRPFTADKLLRVLDKVLHKPA